MARRVALLGAAAVCAVIVGVLGIWLYIGRTGSSDLENWIGHQVVGVLQHHLTPQVTFANIDYQAPRTVVIDDLTFTAEKRTILHVARARLELAEIPQRGKPILIQDVELTAPKLEFITKRAGELIGWTHFVNSEAVRHPETVPKGQRLSDVLVLRHVAIDDGEVIYEGQGGAAERMTLPGIGLRLATPPVENQPGWYRLVGNLKRDPLIDLRLDGRINLDTGLLDVAGLQLAASLGERQYSTLPPALQEFLRRHEIQGALTASAKGQLPLNDPSRFAGTVRADLKDARVRHNGTILPIEAVTVDARLPDGGVDVSAKGVNLSGAEGPGKPLPFFSVGSIAARLGGIPAKGEPLVIESLQVDSPHVVFAARPQGGLAGWSQMAEQTRQPSGETVEKAGKSSASDILQAVHLRQFGIKSGAVTYRPAGGQPLTLDGIEVALTGQPRQDSADVIDVNGTLQAGALIHSDLKGQLDTRAAMLQLERFESTAEVGPGNYESLPPRARDWIKAHDVQGKLTVSGQGSIPLAKGAKPNFAGAAELASARAQFNGVTVPVGQARVRFKFPERHIEAELADVKLISERLPFLSLPKTTARMTLGEGGFALLDELVLEEPTVSFVKSATGGAVGWNRLPTSNEAPHVVLRDAKAVHGTLAFASDPSVEPGRIGGIDLRLQSTGDNPNSPVQVSGKIADELLQGQLAGMLNMKNLQVDVREFVANTAISEDRYARLPEPVKSALAPYQVAGQLTVRATGKLPLTNASAAQLDITGDIKSASLVYNGLRVPIGGAQVRMGSGNQPFSIVAREVAIAQGKTILARAARVALHSPAPPWAAGPPRFDRVQIDQPTFNLVQQPDGTLIGWSQLGKASADSHENGQGKNASIQTNASQAPGPILEELRVDNGELVYASASGHEMMALPGIDITADLEPGPTSSWYRVASQIRRGEFLNMDLKGRFNSTDRLLDLASLTLRAQLTGQENKTLPPSVQELVREHQLRGAFNIEAQGHIPLKNPEQLQGRMSATVRDGMFSYEQTQWPVQQMEVNAEANRGVISGRLNATMLGGTLQASGGASLPQNGSFEVDWQAANVQLEKMMRAVEQGESSYAGTLAGKGQIRGRLGALPESLSGPGELTVEKGRLLKLPLIRHLVVRIITTPLGLNVNRTDRAAVTWQFRNGGVHIQRMAVTSPLVAMEGSGELSYNGQVNMSFRAQPAQAATELTQRLPGPLGRIGNIIGDVGKLGGQIITYEVTGDISNPRVVPAPLGITGK